MNTTKTSTSLFRLAAAAFVVGAVGASSTAMAADAKAPKADAKVATVQTAAKASKVDAKSLRKKTELPRKWRWKKYAKNFDSMFRK